MLGDTFATEPCNTAIGLTWVSMRTTDLKLQSGYLSWCTVLPHHALCPSRWSYGRRSFERSGSTQQHNNTTTQQHMNQDESSADQKKIRSSTHNPTFLNAAYGGCIGEYWASSMIRMAESSFALGRKLWSHWPLNIATIWSFRFTLLCFALLCFALLCFWLFVFSLPRRFAASCTTLLNMLCKFWS
jgi:hypothetical protein